MANHTLKDQADLVNTNPYFEDLSVNLIDRLQQMQTLMQVMTRTNEEVNQALMTRPIRDILSLLETQIEQALLLEASTRESVSSD